MVIDDRRRPVERDMRHHIMPALSVGFGEKIEVGFLNLHCLRRRRLSLWQPTRAPNAPSIVPVPGIQGAESAGQGWLRERLRSKMSPQRHGRRDQNGDLFIYFDLLSKSRSSCYPDPKIRVAPVTSGYEPAYRAFGLRFI